MASATDLGFILGQLGVDPLEQEGLFGPFLCGLFVGLGLCHDSGVDPLEQEGLFRLRLGTDLGHTSTTGLIELSKHVHILSWLVDVHCNAKLFNWLD